MINETFHLSIKNPIISNHSVYGQKLLPGLAYIDILFQFFQLHHYAFNEFELRKVSIYNPLIIGEDYDVMLTIQYSEIREGQWHIVVEGQERHTDGTLALDKKRYATAEIHQTGPVIFDETLDLNQIKDAAQEVISLDEVYEQYRRRDMIHTGFMKAEGKIYEGGSATFIDVSLGQTAHSDVEGFLFHPALIDGSAIGAMTLLSSLVKEEQRLFLPLFYESFRASELILKRCVTRIQTSTLGRKKELVYLTMEFFNESGKKVAELRNFAGKLVRGAELINTSLKSIFQPEAANLVQPPLTNTREPNYEENELNSVTTTEAETFLQQLMADRLKKPVKQIETKAGYYEMGLDSAGLLEIVRAIETKIGAVLSPTLLFEYTTIAELAAYLTENYGAKFNQYSAVMRETLQEAPGNGVSQRQATTVQVTDVQVEDGVFPSTIQRTGRVVTMTAIREEIAIIGMAGRYPKARNLQEFWDNLKTGKDCITEIPKFRWDWKLYTGLKSPSGKNISKWGGFIDDPDCFDAQFFRISPREAEVMDPQERLFLETCWETIEDAGYTPNTLVTPQGPSNRRHVGVFVGVMHKDYTLIGAEAASHGQAVPLSLNYAPIANRVSYFCNFHGPSMAVDTVCSSSLTALHLALESIRHGECEVALAGGVNLSLNPNKYLTYGMMDMHASDGYCHTFGKDGDGYVSGEGVGAVLLKPLHKAVQDGDHIYAVIKGSTINHGGTVSGITVPSPVAQADTITACLEKTSIHPRTISYVEAHGTGTSLGDPIEIEGLAKAFRLYTQDLQYCSIGSVKSNIGHAESAAGISALTKVVLQLFNKTLAPSLHSEELNPHIDFVQSPFFVQHQTEEWKHPLLVEEGRKVSYPRRAGLSSFGATGSNAHIILEEFVSEQMRQQKPAILGKNDSPAIIPLSARNKERLQAYAKKLLEFLQGFPLERKLNLSELAYTLQVGRESMEERVVFLVKDIRELIDKLEAFGEGKERIDHCIRGQVKQSKETIDLLNDRESLELIHKWIKNGKVRKIAELWVKGLVIDWDLFYGGTKPRRISLPTYPFAKERFWVSGMSGSVGATPLQPPVHSFIHPLLHQNTSNFSEQRFSSTFTGQEFFLSDHVVQGQRILPGVAYLEMARMAVVQSAGVPAHSQVGIRLKNMVWVRPIAVGEQPVHVHIGLCLEDSGEITFEIYSEAEETGSEPVVHSQGSAVLNAAAEASALDLLTLQAQCGQSTLSPEQCYEAFKATGIDYGPAHKGIEMVYIGSNQVLAKLSLPLSVSDTQRQFVLHPSLMDSALQASMGLVLSSGDTKPSGSTLPPKPVLPFALQELEIFGNCTSTMWALVRYSDGGKAGDKAHASMRSQASLGVQKLDIDLYDVQGNVRVRMKGLSSRVLEGKVSSVRTAATLGTLMLHPSFQEQAIAKGITAPDYEQHLVLLCETNKSSQEIIESQIGEVARARRCLTLESKHEGIEGRFQDYSTQLFDEIQNILKAKPAGKVLVQIVVPNRAEQQLFTGLSGLLKTARLENSKLIGQLIEIEPDEATEGITEKLKENSRSPIDNHVRYQDGKRLVAVLREIETSREQVKVPWKDRGIYLITGGAGGLGLIFAKEIAHKVKDATLVLMGRSPLSDKKQTHTPTRVLKELQDLGARIEYRQVDVTQEKAVASLIQSIQADFGGIDGIIHSAGLIRDNFITKKTKHEFQEVLAPKVTGLVNLDQASKDLPLDVFILFSSGAGVVGNAGQADYATANAFMDAYAKYRNALVAANQRNGQTLSINWPLWQEGGMHVDAETEKMMRRNTGMVAMQTQVGIQALYQGLASGQAQVMVMEGNLQRLKEHLLETSSKIQSYSETVPGSEGFKTVLFPIQEAHELGQQIIVAESDEVVLHKPERKTGESAKMMKEGSKLKMLDEQAPGHKLSMKQTGGITQDVLREKSTEYIKKLVGETLHISSNKIDSSEPLEKYGIDSIVVVQLANNLGKVLDNITNTLFFEYPTIDALVEYFMSNQTASLLSLVGLEEHKGGQRISNDTNDDEIVIETLPVHSKLVHSKSRRFLQFRDPENKGAKSQPSMLQDIAIIGVSGRYPRARNIQEFWRNLQGGYDCITEIPKERWDHSLYFDADKNKPGKTYCKWGGFIEDVDQFDPLFFNISPQYAEIMDPMIRLFLETVWNLFENAGYTRETLQREYQSRVGVYVGAMYQQYQSFHSDIIRESAIATSSYSSIANRVSHFFNLQGPSIAIDTMCSSSAIAIHMACESLLKGDCQMAIAGGVNLSIHPKKYLGLSLMQILGSHINSRSFGDGDGFLPAEGVGAVLLKPLDKAIQARDSILAVIKSTATNHSGSNAYAVPNPNVQAGLIEENFIKSGIDPRTISYVEAAALGSPLGDPIEITALNKAFQVFTNDHQFCAIGSVKSNIGHAEAASGMSQLTKVILQLQHQQLVPSIKAEPLNPDINFDNTPFYLQRELQEWKRPVVKIDGEEREYPRRATVSSFGAGGSNVHLIVEEYIPMQEETVHTSAASSPQIVVFSARNRDRLQAVVEQSIEFIELQKGLHLPDFAYTLQVGREAMEYRLAMVVNTWEELIQGLKESLKLLKEAGEAETSIPVFTGNIEEDHSSIKKLLSGKLGETLVQMLMIEKNYEKMALYWTKEGKIPWASLHEGQEVRKIILPTYPFERRRCWIESQPEPGIRIESTNALDNNAAVIETNISFKDSDS